MEYKVPYFDPFTFPSPGVLGKSTVGFDELFNKLSRLERSAGSNYPPYNIKKVSENDYVIELAVAGFTLKDLDITYEDGVLSIAGNGTNTAGEDVEYIFRGIATRNFVRAFTLADHVEVTGAKLEDGMLNVSLKRVIPEEKKPRKITINASTPTDLKQLLTE